MSGNFLDNLQNDYKELDDDNNFDINVDNNMALEMNLLHSKPVFNVLL